MRKTTIFEKSWMHGSHGVYRWPTSMSRPPYTHYPNDVLRSDQIIQQQVCRAFWQEVVDEINEGLIMGFRIT